jgi:hypothetical protein
MRLLLLILIFVSLNFQKVSAQFTKSFGILGGYTSASQVFSGIPVESFELKFRSGFIAGIYSEFLNASHFSILAQIEYTQRGTSFDGITTDPDGNSSEETYYSRLDYLSVPISGKLSLKNLHFSPYILAGVRYDHLLSFDSFSLEPVYDKFKKSIFGAQFGIGMDFSNVILLDFALELRYNIDFTNSLSFEDATAYNKAIDFTLFLNLK